MLVFPYLFQGKIINNNFPSAHYGQNFCVLVMVSNLNCFVMKCNDAHLFG